VSKNALSTLRDIILIDDKEQRVEQFKDWMDSRLFNLTVMRRVTEETIRWCALDKDEILQLEKARIFGIIAKGLSENDVLDIQEEPEPNGDITLCTRILALKDRDNA
jgi:hypothetical protein